VGSNDAVLAVRKKSHRKNKKKKYGGKHGPQPGKKEYFPPSCHRKTERVARGVEWIGIGLTGAVVEKSSKTLNMKKRGGGGGQELVRSEMPPRGEYSGKARRGVPRPAQKGSHLLNSLKKNAIQKKFV